MDAVDKAPGAARRSSARALAPGGESELLMPVPERDVETQDEKQRSWPGALVVWAARLLAVLAALATLGILALTLGPRFLPYRVYTALSGSMEPTIPVGSVIVLRPVSADRIAVGDIIVFHRPDQTGQLVTHRVAGIEDAAGGSAFITKGDANPAPDAWRVPADGSGWRYSFGIPYLGYPLIAITSPLGQIALVLLPVLAAALLVLVQIWLPRGRLGSAESV